MVSLQQLTKLLLDAERAHAYHETQLGHVDANWAEWYAEYILENIYQNI